MEIWSGKIIKKYYDFTVFSQITNTDYEGEIKNQGDTVIIRTTPTIVISDYVIGQKLNYQTPVSPPLTLLIDKGKYWGLELEDLLAVQSDIKLLNKWTDDAAMQLKKAIEDGNGTGFFSTIYADSHASNRGITAGVRSASYNMGVFGAPVQVTKADVLDQIIDAGSVLDEQNVPETGRWFVIPTWMSGMIKKSDLKDASFVGGESTLRNGRIGQIDRFTLYSSNLLASVTDGAFTGHYALFGHNDGITFANQLTKTENLRSQDSFADIIRGVSVYGWKAVKPEAFGTFYCRK